MKHSLILWPILLVAALIHGCDDPPFLEEPSTFRHDSPRPPCECSIDTARTPYYAEPVLIATGWSEPIELAEPLNTDCPEDAIEISRDGRTLYFFWSPRVNASDEELLEIETGTYRAERVGGDPGLFADARFFDLGKGADGGSVDGEPSFSPCGDSVYFHSTRIDNIGYQQAEPVDDPMDIYVAAIENGEPGPAVNLGEPVNSVHVDGEHCLSPDGSRLYLSSRRPGGLGDVDIWVSTRTGGVWSVPVNMGPPINSTHAELQPAFAVNDPNTMYFVSDRDGPASIYRSTFDGSTWSAPEMLITGYVGEPSLTGDGQIMYFVHVLVDSSDVFGSDVWYVRREEAE